MPLNFTGRDLPAAEKVPPASRTAVVVLSCFGAAAVLAALVFATALRQHKPPPLLPPLVGTDRALAATPPKPVPAVAFETPEEGVAPGQACALYDRADPDRVLGGGFIASTTAAAWP